MEFLWQSYSDNFLIVFSTWGSRQADDVPGEQFQTYIEELHGREYSNIKDLAQRMHKKEKFVVKDLEYNSGKSGFFRDIWMSQKFV